MRVALAFVFAASCMAMDLAQTVDRAVQSSPLAARSNIGIHVLELKTGKVVYSRDENRLFLPASNMKLFTTALALEQLGPDYRFITRIVEDPGGDLVLVGSGDPSLSGRTYPYRKDAPPGSPLLAIEELADEAVANGLHRVSGNIVGDDRLYPWDPYPPSWTQADALSESGAPVSALSLNDNVINVSISPGLKPGDPASVSLSPALEYFEIDNRVITGARRSDTKVHLSRVPGSRELLLWGAIAGGSANIRESVAIDDPALYAACALYEALTRRGVAIAGHPEARHRSQEEAYEAPVGTAVATRTSPPLFELLQVADKISQNLHAELVLRETGRMVEGSGTRDAGLKALDRLLVEIGAGPGDSRLEDGSGLSRNAEVTPRLVTRLLDYMFRSKDRDLWMSLLPVGGQDGTLEHRLCCLSEAHSIHAKTGTLNRAVALSGYAESRTRGPLAFSILVNNFAATTAEAQSWVDRIALTLVE